MTKRTLLMCRASPYGSTQLRQAIDTALAFCTFDQPLALLLLGDATSLAVDRQSPDPQQSKNLGKMVKALREFNIEHLYVEQAALDCMGMSVPDALFTPVCAARMAELIADSDLVLSV